LAEGTCFQQAGSSMVEDTSQPVTISKKWTNPSSALHRKRTWVQALPWFSRGSLGLPASGTDLKWGRACTQALSLCMEGRTLSLGWDLIAKNRGTSLYAKIIN
jgi:hypothetical protein